MQVSYTRINSLTSRDISLPALVSEDFPNVQVTAPSIRSNSTPRDELKSHQASSERQTQSQKAHSQPPQIKNFNFMPVIIIVIAIFIASLYKLLS